MSQKSLLAFMLRISCLAFAFLALAAPAIALAAPATLLDTDVNADGLNFTGTDAFAYGTSFSQDTAASYNGNDILVQTMYAQAAGGTGAGISVPVSNGENGINQTLDGPANTDVNNDVPNATPANAVFATIGNASGKLENGNVIRFSMWVRSDPVSPVTKAPQIEPVLKFELWKEALSTFADFNGGQPQPYYGDKVIDTDQHLGQGIWIDLDNDGAVIDAAAAAEGRIRTVTTTAWTLVEAQYVVDDSKWIGIGDDPYTVADIEEIRGVMFWGDFENRDLTNGGSLWFDNVRMEVFKDLASVTPNSSPNPALSEGGPPGDFDNDFDVDAADLTTWKGAFGLTAAGDADDDGDSDGQDFLIWQRNRTAPAVGAVPEPASASLIVLGVLGILVRRRNQRV